MEGVGGNNKANKQFDGLEGARGNCRYFLWRDTDSDYQICKHKCLTKGNHLKKNLLASFLTTMHARSC